MTKNKEDVPVSEDTAHETAQKEPTENIAEAPDNTTDIPKSLDMPEDETVKPTKHRWSKRKKLLIFGLPIIVIIAATATALLTPIGYPVLTFIHKPLTITIKDADFHSELEDVSIKLDGKTITPKGDQPYSFTATPGKHTLDVSKKYYKTSTTDLTVKPFGNPLPTFRINLKATGRPVFVQINQRITGKPLENVTVTVNKSAFTTDKNGKALVIVPAELQTTQMQVSKEGYKAFSQDIIVPAKTEKDTVDPKNLASITPLGSIFFLSKRSGKIDVMKSDLDGGDAQVVIAGTGQEDPNNTVLLATRDWKYLALLAVRSDQKQRVYTIETSTGKLTTADEGDATFFLAGWEGHTLIYSVNRNVTAQPGHYKIKSYNAEADKLATLDVNQFSKDGNKSQEEYFGPIFLSGTRVLYSVGVQYGYNGTDYKQRFISINNDGTDKKILMDNDPLSNGDILVVQSKPKEFYLYYYVYAKNDNSYYEYAIGDASVKALGEKDKIAHINEYYAYLLSPNGKNTLWAESRDGKNALFIGNADGEDGKEVANLSEYDTYGWYTDDYILVTKKGSELYIMSAAGGTPVKVTDYHKPAYNFNSYGGGYGGR